MRRRLLRPAVVIPTIVLALLGAGIGYAAYEQLDTSAVEANADLLAVVPPFPGARERDRRSDASTEGSLPVPSGVVTTVLYLPPPAATQEDVVAYYVSRLRGWRAATRTVPAAGTQRRAYRVSFTRADDCLTLMTYGMVPGQSGARTYAVAARAGDGAC